MRRTGDIEGVRQSSGNWQRGDNISWTKRSICEPLDKYRILEISQRMYENFNSKLLLGWGAGAFCRSQSGSVLFRNTA